MRTVTAIALFLAAPALAQPDDCVPGPATSHTDCIVDANPSVIRDIGEDPGSLGDTAMDLDVPEGDRVMDVDVPEGATTADDDTSAGGDPVVEGFESQTGSLDVRVGGVLSEDYEELVTPEEYGFDPAQDSAFYEVGDRAVRINRETREIQEVRPLAGIGTGPVGDTPGIGIQGSPLLDAGETPEVGIGQTPEAGLDDALDTGVEDIREGLGQPETRFDDDAGGIAD